jgi:hypothetical protein
VSDRDVSAIASWSRFDQGDDPGRDRWDTGPRYVCVDCDWRGTDPLFHYVNTGHAVRGKDWSAGMGNCLWTDSDAEGRRVTDVPTEVRRSR